MRTLFALLLTSLCFVSFAPRVTLAQEPSAPEPAAAEGAQEVWICPMECDGLVFDEAGDCPVCGMYLEQQSPQPSTLGDDIETGGFFDADALTQDVEEFPDERPETALMPGVDQNFFYVGTAGLVIITLLLLFLLGEPRRNMKKTSKRWEYPRFELTKFRPVKRLVTWRGFQPMLQIPIVLLFGFVLFAGFFGSQEPGRNIAPVLTWNIWWMGLIFFAFFAGEIWCTVCPWMAVPDWLARLGAKVRGAAKPLGLHRPWPRWMRNLYPAIALFVVVTWLELAYEAPYRPALTASMGLMMLVFAAATLFVFERKGFCRHVCLVGRVTGAYGTTGMLEIRRRDTDVCHACRTKDCLHGNERGLPCPTWEYMGAMNENTYCTMCTECLKTCPHDNIALNVRAPIADLMGPHRKRLDEAWLLLAIFVVTIFHGLAMIPLWTHDIVPPFREHIVSLTGFDVGYLTTFTLAMTLVFAGAVGLYALSCWVTKVASGNVAYRFKDYFIAFAYPILPLSLAYHMAHNSLHFFYEGSKLVRLASDPFGWGWDLFGTANAPLTLLLPIDVLWGIQIALVVAGQFAGIWLVRRTAFRMFGNRRQALRATVAMSICLALLSLLALWLLNQPMEMRTA